jgi:hypothetical protein
MGHRDDALAGHGRITQSARRVGAAEQAGGRDVAGERNGGESSAALLGDEHEVEHGRVVTAGRRRQAHRRDTHACQLLPHRPVEPERLGRAHRRGGALLGEERRECVADGVLTLVQ